jgi:hypothetical protein
MVHMPALTLKHDMYTPITEASSLLCNLLHGFAKLSIIWTTAFISDAGAVNL